MAGFAVAMVSLIRIHQLAYNIMVRWISTILFSKIVLVHVGSGRLILRSIPSHPRAFPEMPISLLVWLNFYFLTCLWVGFSPNICSFIRRILLGNTQFSACR
jgi:hypothetical protein